MHLQNQYYCNVQWACKYIRICITLLCFPFQKTLQNVTITEITGRDEALTVQDNGGNVMWIFEVSATVS